MPVTLQDVLKQLDVDEPDYTALASLGSDALPHLAVLVRDEDPGVAAKAAYLASLIQSDDSIDVLAAAATSAHDVVRVAAAAGLKNTTAPRAAALADQLMGDADPGVRKQALTAAAAMDSPALALRIKRMASKDRVSALRQMAGRAMRQRSRPASGAKSSASSGRVKRSAATRRRVRRKGATKK